LKNPSLSKSKNEVVKEKFKRKGKNGKINLAGFEM
jgi:hypothetical protein